MRESQVLRLVVPAEVSGLRLDRFLARAVPGMSRSEVRHLIETGAVRFEGRPLRKGDPVRPSSEITVALRAQRAEPDARVAIDVRYETDALVVVSKPAGLPVAPLRLGETGTLANGLVARYPEMAGVGYSAREPGLVHRLDTQTSGLVIAARTEDAFAALRAALSSLSLTKRYLAIVSGTLPRAQGEVRWLLEPQATKPRRVAVRKDTEGRHVTAWRHLLTRNDWTLVELTAPRAYRHQLRAHLSALGCPIAGDATYGGRPAPGLGSRHALHASYVAWAGTRVVPGFTLRDPLPRELGSLIDDPTARLAPAESPDENAEGS